MSADGQRQSACWRCAYFDRDPDETEEGGYCRRYPPTTEGLHAMWPGVEYLDWCGEFEELHADYERGVEQASTVYKEVIRGYVAENAKLRELVRDMFSYAFNREIELCNACVEANGEYADCAACGEYDGACGIAKKRLAELYADRMREFGVEVDA